MPRQFQSCGSVLLVIALLSPAFAGQTQCRVEDRGMHADEKPAYDLLVRCGGKCNVTYEGRLLHVWASQPVTAEFIASLGRCKAIESLSLGGDDESFAALAALPDLPTLEAINFTRTLTGKEEVQWVEHVPNVLCINLEVPGSEGSADRTARPRELPGAADNAAGPDRTVGALTKLGKLYLLRLNGQPITDASGAHLAQLKNLHHLELKDTPIGNAGVKRLSALANLTTLLLDRTQVGDEGVLALAELGNLQHLTLNGTAITDRALEAFAGGPLRKSIRSLRLDYTAITDAGLKLLEGAGGLQALSVSHTRVTDAGLVYLRGMKSLGTLAADGTAVTREGTLTLKQRSDTLRYAYVSEKPAEATGVSTTRPLVQARLKSGAAVEGMLMRFADGVYVVRLGDSLQSFQEAEIESISFSGPQPAQRAASRERALPRPRVRRAELPADLARLGVDTAPQAVKLLADSDPQVRIAAARAIGRWAASAGTIIPREIEGPLVKALHDENAEVRNYATEILWRMGESSDSVVPPLVDALKKDPDRQVACSAAVALHRIAKYRTEGKPSLKPILEALGWAAADHADAAVRGRAIWALGELGPKALPAAEALRRACDDPNSQVQEAACRARNQIGDTLRAALAKTGADEEVIAALVELKGPRGFQVSEELQRRRSEAQQRLKTAGAKNLDALMAAVRCDDDNSYWNELAQIIAAWGEAVLPSLSKYADDNELRVRRTVAMALGDMPLKTMPDVLPKLLHDPEEWVRDTAATSLTRMVGPRFPFGGRHAEPTPAMVNAAVPLLLEALAGSRLTYQQSFQVASTLAEIGGDHPDVVPAMLKMLKESTDHMQRDNIVSALGRLAGRIRGDEKVKPIVQALAGAIDSDTDNVVRLRAAAFLGYLGPRGKAALPALKRAEDDANPAVAKNAREAVARIEGHSEEDGPNRVFSPERAFKKPRERAPQPPAEPEQPR
jgi:HEAT repeat protein